MSLRNKRPLFSNKKSLFPMDGSEIINPETFTPEEYARMQKEEADFIWQWIFKLIYIVLFVWFLLTIVGAYNEAAACERTTLHADYHHNSLPTLWQN